MPATEFDLLSDHLTAAGPDAVLTAAANTFREQKRYHDLFEVLKMQVRRRIGLPLMYSDSADQLSEEQRTRLEDGLIAACREVGSLLIREGKVREGWMYLRPVGDKSEALALLQDVEAQEDNLDELVEVLLHEGIDIGRGFGLILSSYGTCNAITTYDQSVGRRSRAEQQPAARQLLHRVHTDLLANVKADVARQEGAQPSETTLKDLIADREWLFSENSYHLDTTHLAATVRIARVLEDKADLRLARDLTEYGRRLSTQFQYAGDEPFAETYPAHALYYSALLGENVDEALAYFRQKAELLDARYHGLTAIETYVELLARLGRYDEAIDAAIQLTPADANNTGWGPSLLELAGKAGRYDKVIDYCKSKGDLLGYTVAVVQSASQS
jgi:tetratricopeptide (TPR) repeat protein